MGFIIGFIVFVIVMYLIGVGLEILTGMLQISNEKRDNNLPNVSYREKEPPNPNPVPDDFAGGQKQWEDYQKWKRDQEERIAKKRNK